MLIHKRINDSKNILLLVTLMVVLVTALIYGIVLDLFLIIILVLAAFAIGSFFKMIHANAVSKIIIQTAVGLGILGVVIYIILFFGFGSRSLYCLILILPILFRYKYVVAAYKDLESISPMSKTQVVLWIAILIAFVFYIACASAPMDKYDTMTKHLPITMYAADNGQWYNNVTESLVYGETMVLQYTFSALFASFACYKALSLFNVILIFFIFGIILRCAKTIYCRTNSILMAIIFFSTPMFFEFSTIFYVDIMPAFFVFTSILCFIDHYGDSWRNLNTIAFLFGCGIFSKLTSIYTILVVGLVCISCGVYFAAKNHQVCHLPIKFLQAFVIFISPFIISVVNIWFSTKNPLFPMYNGLFKSPFFATENFVDPFNTHPIGLTVQSLINIVMHTDRNIEMYPGGLGYFLFFIAIIPVALLLYRKKRFVVCCIVPFAAFMVSCIFTYNLRYSMMIFMLLAALVSISVSIIIEKAPKYVRIAALSILLLLLSLPNLIYIYGHYSVPYRIQPRSAISSTANVSLLSQVPDNKKILSLNDPFKGNYIGYYSAYMWHNTYMIHKIQSGALRLEDYVGSFEYVLYQKQVPILYPEVQSLHDNDGTQDSILEKIDESETHILYKVKSAEITLISKEFTAPMISKTSAPITEVIPQNYDSYMITHDIINTTMRPIEMRWQINWQDADGAFVGCSISTYIAQPGRNTYESPPIKFFEGASYGILYITSHNDEEITVYGYELTATGVNNIIEDETKAFESGTILYKMFKEL